MNALFLADAHLRGSETSTQEKVLRLLGQCRGRAKGSAGPGHDGVALTLDLLVIAGDFFDFWFSRDERIYPAFQPVIDRLVSLKEEGVRIILCEGNHDFDLDDYFVRHLGFEVHDETLDLNLEGRKILVAHGDTVDRDNRGYLVLRQFLRGTLARFMRRTLPLSLLWAVARLSSAVSKRRLSAPPEVLAVTMRRYASARFKEGYDAVILGHCHQTSLIQEGEEGAAKTFAILGDWLVHDSYLLYQEGRFTLHQS